MTISSDTKPAGVKKSRPLSPHIQIYKPQITSGLSILHRITGVILSGGMVIVVAWLAALAGGPESYTSFLNCAKSIPGQVVLCGLTFAFFFHLCAGMRHLMWDMGFGFDLKDVYRTGRIVIITSILLTLIVLLDVYGVSL